MSSTTSRRSFLRTAAMAPALAVPAGAVLASECAMDRANRLAWELADALNTYAGGRFYSVVYPSARDAYAVNFSLIDLPPIRVVSARERVDAAFQELKDAVTALGPDSHVDYAIHNKVGANTVWLITAKDGPAPAVI